MRCGVLWYGMGWGDGQVTIVAQFMGTRNGFCNCFVYICTSLSAMCINSARMSLSLCVCMFVPHTSTPRLRIATSFAPTLKHRLRILRVEQTETPAMLKARNKKLTSKSAKKAKCVAREVGFYCPSPKLVAHHTARYLAGMFDAHSRHTHVLCAGARVRGRQTRGPTAPDQDFARCAGSVEGHKQRWSGCKWG